MISHYFIIPTVILASIGILNYLRLAFGGKVKPNSVSWFFWFLSPFIIYLIMLGEGVKFIDSIPIFLAWLLNGFVFMVSVFNKNSFWQLKSSDYVFLFFGLCSIGIWLILDDPILAVTFSILGDVFAGIPTLIKSYKNPETESLSPYLLPIPNLLVGILILPTITYLNSAYIFWLLFSNSLKVVLISKIYLKLS